MSIEKISGVWPEWKIVEEIGTGGFAKVYKAVREEHSMTTFSAIKVISIPQNNSEIANIKAEGLDDKATRTYFQGIVDDFINEIKLMESLKGISNIVSVEDFKVIEKKGELGWDIFIRMELLTPLNKYTEKTNLSEAEIIKIGIDICSALEICAKKNIIHRDIKPENIFVSDLGDFKVGDFGIAKELEKTGGTMSSKGTYSYMAPEVVQGKKYNASVDTYSLGIVLYKLLNNNRLPFIDLKSKEISYQDRKNAIDRRLCGEALPAPVNASKNMAAIIKQACAFDPGKRFANATAFKKALISLKNGGTIDLDATVAAVSSNNGNTAKTAVMTDNTSPKKKKNKSKFVLALIAVILIGGGIFAGTKIISNSSKNAEKTASNSTNNNETGNSENNKEISSDKHDETNKETDASGDATEDQVSALNDRISKVLLDFKDKKIDYYTAKLELENIADMDVAEVTNNLNTTKKSIENLYASRQAYDAAKIYEENSEYIKAIAEYKKVIDIDSDYENAKKKIIILEDSYRTQILDEASGLANNKDYIGAVEILNNALEVMAGDTAITKQINIYETDYVNDVISKSNKFVEEKKYDDAVTIVEEAQKIVKNNSALSEQIENINNQRPKNFMEVCKPYDNTALKYNEYLADVLEGFMMAGEERKNGFTVSGNYHGKYYVLSNLNGKYKELEFDVGHVDGSDMDNVKLIIYLDDVQVNTYEINADMYPLHISLNLEGKKQIKFFIDNYGYSPKTGFADMTIK